MKTAFNYLLLSLSILFVSSCSSDDDNKEFNYAEKVIGQWVTTAATSNPAMPILNGKEWTTDTDWFKHWDANEKDDIIEYKPDGKYGTWEKKGEDFTLDGTFKVEGNKIVHTESQEEDEESFVLVIKKMTSDTMMIEEKYVGEDKEGNDFPTTVTYTYKRI